MEGEGRTAAHAEDRSAGPERRGRVGKADRAQGECRAHETDSEQLDAGEVPGQDEAAKPRDRERYVCTIVAQSAVPCTATERERCAHNSRS